MARFLSPEWFAELEAPTLEGALGNAVTRGAEPALLVEISVAGTPQGAVRYQVMLDRGTARVLPPGRLLAGPQVTVRADYSTWAGIASGATSALDALSQGSAKLSGDTSALFAQSPSLDGRDLVPPTARARTSY
jgi:hypothetical protein